MAEPAAGSTTGKLKRKEPESTSASTATAVVDKPAAKKKRTTTKEQAKAASASDDAVVAVAAEKEEGEIEDADKVKTVTSPTSIEPTVSTTPMAMTGTALALTAAPPVPLPPPVPIKLSKKQRKAARHAALVHQQNLARHEPVLTLSELAPNYFTPERYAAHGASAANMSLQAIKQEAVTLISHLLSWGVTPEYILSAGVSAPIVKVAFDRLNLVMPAQLAEKIEKRARKIERMVPPELVPTDADDQPPCITDVDVQQQQQQRPQQANEQAAAAAETSATVSKTLADLEKEKRLLLLARKSALKRKNAAADAAAFANEVENMLAEKAASASDPDASVNADKTLDVGTPKKEAVEPPASHSQHAHHNNHARHRPTAAEFLSFDGGEDGNEAQNKVIIDLSDSDGEDSLVPDQNTTQKSPAPPAPTITTSTPTPVSASELAASTSNALSEKEKEIRLLMVKIKAMEARKKRLKQKEDEAAAASAKSQAATPEAADTPAAAVSIDAPEAGEDGTATVTREPSVDTVGTPPRPPVVVEVTDSSSSSSGTPTPPPETKYASDSTPTPPPPESGVEEDAMDADDANDDDDHDDHARTVQQHQQQLDEGEQAQGTTKMGSFFSRYSSPFLRFPSLRSSPLPNQLGPSSPSMPPVRTSASTSASVDDAKNDGPLRAWVARRALGTADSSAKRICKYEASGGKCADAGCLSVHFKDYDYTDKDIREYMLDTFTMPATASAHRHQPQDGTEKMSEATAKAVEKEREALFRRGIELKLDALAKPLTFERARRATADYWDEVAKL